MRFRFSPLVFLVLLLGSVGCSNIDCPLDNVVMMQCNLYASETGQPLKLTDTLTVKSAGHDTVLLNRATGVNSFLLPLKEGATLDTLLLCLSNSKGQRATDTLFVEHEPHLHFESLDCPASFFHTLKRVRVTSHPLSQLPLTVDSVSLIRSTVNYDDIENLRIFLRATSNH
ncbi:hypothetical protein, secreted [gut metagenome]|uniref:Lipoprotein n=1 Tax=gut metagenome TaxID=749906 RepID=J9GP28_9ZZZZ